MTEPTVLGITMVAVGTVCSISTMAVKGLMDRRKNGGDTVKCPFHDDLVDKVAKIDLAVCGDGGDKNKGLVRKVDGIHTKLDFLIGKNEKEASEQ